MKRWRKVICAVLVLLAALLAGLYGWQRENVRAVTDAVQYTSGELEEKLVENRQVIRDAVEAAPEIVVREVTEEERQALRDGAMSREELAERLQDAGGQTAPSSGDQAAEIPAETGDAARAADFRAEARVARRFRAAAPVVLPHVLVKPGGGVGHAHTPLPVGAFALPQQRRPHGLHQGAVRGQLVPGPDCILSVPGVYRPGADAPVKFPEALKAFRQRVCLLLVFPSPSLRLLFGVLAPLGGLRGVMYIIILYIQWKIFSTGHWKIFSTGLRTFLPLQLVQNFRRKRRGQVDVSAGYLPGVRVSENLRIDVPAGF